MKVEEVIRKRRSVREYKKGIPGIEKVNKILEAGIWAPSGLNNQPWKFKIIRDKKQKSALARFTKYGEIIKNAPVVICVFLNKEASYNRDKDIMAVGACIQNMLLQAYELGLGSCWLGEILNKKKEVERYLEINSVFELMAVITLGFPKEAVTKGNRNPLKSFLLD